MRSMTFLVNDRSTGGRIPAVAVTITENSDGSLSFDLNVIGPYTGDLRGFFFDLADESRIGTLTVMPTSAGFTEFRQGNDSIKDLGNGANMHGLLGSDGGYDAGIEIGTAGIGKDDYQSFSFTLTSSAGALTLEDFANVDFGLRLTSVGWDGDGCGDGDRDGAVKLLEHTSSAIDARDDANAVAEDQAPNAVGGNVFANDANLKPVHFVTAVNGSAWNVGHELEGTYGTLRLHLNGSYTYTLDNTKPAVQALAGGQQVTETFSYTAKNFDEFTSFSTDSALLNITITGANDAPEITGNTSGKVFEDGSRNASGQLVANDLDQGDSLVWSVDNPGTLTNPSYRFLIDNFSITRNGQPYFNDTFGDNVPPPSGPGIPGELPPSAPFPPNTPANYTLNGSFLESGGRVILDGSRSIEVEGIGNPAPRFATSARLLSNNSNAPADLTRGLKIDDSFTVEGRFDLVLDLDPRDNYGVRLSDSGMGVTGSDLLQAVVRLNAAGNLEVALVELDGPSDTSVTLQTIALVPVAGENQIVLRLSHDPADAGVIHASFDLLGGPAPRSFSFAEAGHIFGTGTPADTGDDELFTRAEFRAVADGVMQNGVYGTLSVEADGEWHYALNNAAPNVQALAQGEHATDTFTVRVTDEHGAFDTETVTIDVTGSNDVPVITSPAPNALVVEDFVPTASGQFSASDVDHGAVLTWSAGRATIVPTGPSSFQVFGYSSDYHFTVDQLTIERNGVTIFNDPFADGLAPPSAPNFSNGTPANYLTNFARFSEAGDRLILDGSAANAVRGIGNSDLVVGHLAVLGTNIDPADLTRGLKSDDDFKVEARFDLITPGVRQGYGLSLTDNTTNGLPPDQLGDDGVNLFVRADAAGNLRVEFTRFDIPTDTVTLYQSLTFTPQDGENQIVLRLVHDADEPGLVHAEFDLLGGAGGPRTLQLSETGHIFGSGTPGYAGDDENWTRAQIVAFGPDTAGNTFQGTYGALTVEQNGVWTYTLDNGSASVQALAQNEFAQDIISVRVMDEHGLSSFRPVFISVQGTNDPVVITSGPQGGTVVEDADTTPSPDDSLSAFGTITFTDPDLADFHNAFAFFNPTPDNPFSLGSFNLGFVDEAPNAANGSVGWTYNLNNAAAQHLAQGQTVFETYTVFVNDPWGLSAPQDVTIAIIGTDEVGGNSPPDITGGTTEGLVFEDGARLARGELTAIDADQDALSWSLASGALFGSAAVDATGQWTYTLDNTRFDVQRLAQHETLNDSFLVRVSDEHGAFDPQSEQVVTVQIKGADDRPFVNSPVPFPPPTVSEDGVLTANGQATAFDVDNGAQLTWSLSRGTAFGYLSNNHVEMDRFSVVKNGAVIFADEFDDGIAPPSSPNPMVGYAANGAYSEMNGKLIMDGAGSVGFTGVGFNGLLVGHSTLLNTNTNPADTVLGLKSNHDFTIEGIFDLVVPDEPREGYGLQLTDALPGSLATNLLGDDQVSLLVRKSPLDGLVRVQLTNSNTVTDTFSAVDGVPLDPAAGDQIRLRLTHDDAAPGTVTASFEYLSGGLPSGIGGVLAPTQIFGRDTALFAADDENWTRAGFLTLSPDQYEHTTTLAGTYGTLSIDPTGLWSYTLDNAALNVQALAQDQNVVDSFHLRITDEFGLSNSQLLNITVTGINDAPVAVDDLVPGQVSEDQHALINVLGNDFDVDHDPILVTMHNSFSVLGARITLGPAGTLDYDPSTSSTLQNLNPGQSLVDTFTYVITDTKADSLPATVTVTVFGVEDGPNTPPDITGGDMTGQVYEDGAADVARGLLTALDPDPGAVLTWTLDTTPDTMPAFGFANVDLQTGQWTYFLNNGLVQQLAQGGSVQDDFVVRVTDQHGAFDTQTVTINVTGTGDRPNFTTPPLALSVSEDGVFVSGQTSAFDVDNGNVLHWSLNRGSALGYFSDYEFRADSFSIEKNGAPLFHDDFDAGGPPPSAPAFGYSTTGKFQESGGKLVMRGSDAFAFRGTGNNALVVGNEAILATNVDPNLDELQKNHQFVVEGVFDLIEPLQPRQAYGLTLTDGVNQVADDLLSLTVRRDPGDGHVYVQFVNNSAVLDTSALVDRDLLVAGGADQIRLMLSHQAGSGDVSAFYELLTGGVVTGSGSLGQAGIFGTDTALAGDDENWIRAGLFSNATDPGEFVQTLAGAYGTLMVDNSEVNSIGQLIYTPGAAAQALAQGESVIDSFFVRVIDPQGMSNSQRVDVTVTGFNDPPVAAADSNSVVEDVVTKAVGNVLTNDFDVDHGSFLTVATPGVFPGAYGTLTLNTNGSYEYQLNHDLADFLAEGQVVHDIFEGVYGITDGAIPNFATLLDIEITGTGETPVPLAGEVFEDGSRSASGHLTAEGLDPASGLTWTVENPVVLATPDYRFLIDNFRIVRNGAELFNDDFGAGGPPPTAPNFSGTTTPASYGVGGTFTESGGRAIMDGSFSVPITSVGTTDPFHGSSALLLTDTTTDMTRGLKSDDSFSAEGRFDLVMPDRLEAYGIRLTDIQANDIVDLRVRHEADGIVKVVLRDVDVPANTITTLGTLPLNLLAGENQIVLRLTHDVADPGVIHASFDLLGGAAPRSFSFVPVGHIFGSGTPGDPSDDEVFTRAQIVAIAPSDIQNGTYGTLHLENDGDWSYALDNSAAGVQASSQGESVSDMFLVRATDGHGASDTQVVRIDVVGTDDAPVNVGLGFASFFQGGGVNGTYVIEDSAQQVTRGHAFATDVDHGASVQWSVSRTAYQASYHFTLDDLLITKNGGLLLNDTFSDGIAPPSAPNFANGSPASYLTNGAGFSESGGHLILDGSMAGAVRGTGIPSLVAGHLALLASNIDPADLTRGLKIDDDFTVETRFDLAIPGQAGQGYGVSLQDNVTGGLPPDQLGDDLIAIELVRNSAGDVVVRLVERDVVADQITTLDSTPFAAAPGEDQIALRLNHLASQPGVVHASFDVYDDGLVTRHVDFGAVGHIFGSDTPGYAGDDENWTRVQLTVFGPDTGGPTVQGTYGSLSIDSNGDFTYTLDNAAANVQALLQGQVAVDSFNVRATDQYGVSNRVPLNINVIGTGDGPPVAVDATGGPANEVFVGSSLADRFAGGGGGDLLIGLDGSDLFDYNAVGEGTDTIADFTPGAGGDKLDLHDLLQNYLPEVSNPADFVQLQEFPTANGPNTTVAVDIDGPGFNFAYMPLATLQGVGGLQFNDFAADNLLL